MWIDSRLEDDFAIYTVYEFFGLSQLNTAFIGSCRPHKIHGRGCEPFSSFNCINNFVNYLYFYKLFGVMSAI